MAQRYCAAADDDDDDNDNDNTSVKNDRLYCNIVTVNWIDGCKGVGLCAMIVNAHRPKPVFV